MYKKLHMKTLARHSKRALAWGLRHRNAVQSVVSLACLFPFGLVLAACADHEPTEPGATDTSRGSRDGFPVELRGPCDAKTGIGGFKISLLAGYSSVGGEVASGVVPGNIPEIVETVDNCRLLKKLVPFCDPACSPTETCDFNGECIPYPTNQDIGVVTIRGLEAPVEMEPREPGMNYFQAIDSKAHPIFVEESHIVFTSTDGYLGKLELFGVGFASLEPLGDEWVVDSGKSLSIDWIPPASPEYTSIHFDISVDQHGTSPYRLVCDLADTGAAVIPSVMIDALLSAGVSGYPNGHLIRKTVDSSIHGEACVQFEVVSPADFDVRVAGTTPCDSDKDCPDGQTCDMIIHLCQ